MSFFDTLSNTYLFLVGILPNGSKSQEKFLFISLIFCNITLLTGIIIGIFATGDSAYKTEDISHLFSILFVFGIRCTSYVNREILIQLSKKLCGNFTFMLKNDVTFNAEQEVKKALKPFSVFISFLVVSLTVPILRSIFQNVDYKDPSLYAVPFWFAHGEVKSFAEYLLTVVILNFLCLIDIVTYWCFTVFLISIIFTFSFHLKEIDDYMEKIIDSDVLQKFEDNKKACDERMIQKLNEKEIIQKLKYLVQYQQLFYGYLKDFIIYLRWPFSLILTWFTLTTVLVTYAFFQVTENNAFVVRIMALNGNLLVGFYIFCNVAEITSNQNERLRDLFYNIKWYLLSPKVRQILIAAMTHCHQQFNIKAYGMYTINLNLHIKALRIVISAVNILLILNK